MRKYLACFLGLALVLGFVGMSSAAIVIDPTGDTIGTGTTDITAAQAEVEKRTDGQLVLKVSYTATPDIGGIVIFEADVDNSTGTGGTATMTGVPVPPLNTQGKKTAGTDVGVYIMNRDQGPLSQCGISSHERLQGEYFALSMAAGTDTVGVVRGYLDPSLTKTGTTQRSYTLPWAMILLKAHAVTPGVGKQQFNLSKALDNLLDAKWQLSVWTDDAFTDRDDLADKTTNPPFYQYFNISDVVPNGNGNLADMDTATALTWCEGNFDNDLDVDGVDAKKFKSDMGRGKMSNPCPNAGWLY